MNKDGLVELAEIRKFIPHIQACGDKGEQLHCPLLLQQLDPVQGGRSLEDLDADKLLWIFSLMEG